MKPPDEILLPVNLIAMLKCSEEEKEDSDIPYIRKDLVDERDKLIVRLVKDWADDDTAIRKLALTVLPEKDVNGDTLGVPDIVTIVETLVRRIKVLERAFESFINDSICKACRHHGICEFERYGNFDKCSLIKEMMPNIVEYHIEHAEQELEQDDDTTDR